MYPTESTYYIVQAVRYESRRAQILFHFGFTQHPKALARVLILGQ